MPASLPSGKLKLSAILMISAIIGIGVFQSYWLKKLYMEEWAALKKETNIAFRDAIYKLQLEKFRKDTLFTKHNLSDNLFLIDVLDSLRDRLPDRDLPPKGEGTVTFSIETHIGKDSALRKISSGVFPPRADSVPGLHRGSYSIMNLMAGNDTANTDLPASEVDSAFRRELEKSQISIPFTIRCFIQSLPDQATGPLQDSLRPASPDPPSTDPSLNTSIVNVGLSKVHGYQATFGNSTGYLLGRMKLPIAMAFLLLAFIIAAFVFLYLNLQQQQRLAITRDEFIGNMTHELKTPIATVQVAVEALRHFNALDDSQKTKEYLDISAMELQRLSMLVDKVLRQSLFEHKSIDLNRQTIDLHQLAAEVIAGMKLQFEKASAVIQLTTGGTGFPVSADRMHMAGALSNLLDNALRYSPSRPVITVHLSRHQDLITMAVSDNGIGIPTAYINRVFEKFFRVPSGDRHNIKGYGLGLSYVHHIVTRHNGSITVQSKEGKGSTFTISLPADIVHPSPYQSPIA